jgi:hypothetical protein
VTAPGDGAVGTCYGLSVRSELPLQALRTGTTGRVLEVGRTATLPEPESPPYMEWRDDSGWVYSRLWEDGPGWRLWIDQCGWFHIDPAAATVGVSGAAAGARWEAKLLGIPLALCLREHEDVLLHAAAVERDGRAVLLAAPGQHGKTTLAGAFLRSGYRLLSEDLTCVRLDPVPVVLPGPALLRVRPDVFSQVRFPGTTVARTDPDRVHLLLDEQARGDGAPVPLAAVVLLRRSETPAQLSRTEGKCALPDLWTLSFKLPTDEDRSRCLAGLAGLVGHVPVHDLHRRLSYDELAEVMKLVEDGCLTP